MLCHFTRKEDKYKESQDTLLETRTLRIKNRETIKREFSKILNWSPVKSRYLRAKRLVKKHTYDPVK